MDNSLRRKLRKLPDDSSSSRGIGSSAVMNRHIAWNIVVAKRQFLTANHQESDHFSSKQNSHSSILFFFPYFPNCSLYALAR